MDKKLLWEKYRPQNLNDIILLPRIRKEVDDGIADSNLILFGKFGTGKTSLAKLLVENKAVMYFNTSFHTSIDILRNDIKKHVDTMSSIFDPSDTYKYVFLDEFEKASSQYQDALKSFIEEYSDTTRFIFTTNHIHKVDGGIISRCTRLDFNPNSEKEIKWLKGEYKKKLIHICDQEEIDIPEIDIKRIVSYNFPDMRQMIEILSSVKRTGIVDYTTQTFDTQLKESLYNVLGNTEMESVHKFIMDNFGPEKIQELFNLCGRPLIETLMTKRKDLLKTYVFGDIYNTVSEHSMWLNTIKGGDPIVTASSCLHNIRKIINNG